MAASAFSLFILAANGRTVKSSKDMEAIFKTLSVSADGNDNGLTISESSGKFSFNAKVLAGIAAGSASGEAVEFDQLNTALADYIPLTQKGAANGVASLDASGKLPSAQVPPLAVTSVSVAADEAAQLALTLEEGDVVIRTDESKTYVHNGGTAGDMTDFTEIVTPGTGVQTVNGQAGPNVVLDTDDVDEGSTNLYFTEARAKAAAVADAISDSVTDVAPSQNAVFDALALKQDKADLARSLTNNEGGSTAHTIRQVVFLSAFGQAKLAQATNAALSEKSLFLMVKDATIADQASGSYWLPKKGTVVGGFTSLVFNDPIYLSRTAAGGFQTTVPATSGDHVVRLGYAISATEIVWDPSYEYQVA